MIDVVKIKIKAGDGGDGALSFRREKFVPFGGPDGGDGGDGGSVYLVASTNLVTLRDFKSKEVFAAQDGEKGGKRKMFGSSRPDLFVKVPVGTLIYEIKDGREILVGDLVEDGSQMLIAQGGTGGKGNFRFKSSTNQTPVQYGRGGAGEEKTIKMEIKLVADIGLVGLPNAGKSTLINKLTQANVKVANYPFTTLTPNLGTMTLNDGQPVIIADIPGLIEGASEGKGLGDEFLRHIERTRLLIHLVDPLEGFTPDGKISLAKNTWANFEKIRKELKSYGHGLNEKPEVTVINKIDLTEIKDEVEAIKVLFNKHGVSIYFISGVTGEGLQELFKEVQKLLIEHKKIVVFNAETPVKLYDINNLPNKKIVFGSSRVVSLKKEN